MSFLPPTKPRASFAPPIRGPTTGIDPLTPSSSSSAPNAGFFSGTKSNIAADGDGVKDLLPESSPSLGGQKASSYLVLDEIEDDMSNSFLEDFLDISNQAFLPLGQGDVSASVIQDVEGGSAALEDLFNEDSLDLTQLTAAKPQIADNNNMDVDEEDGFSTQKTASQVLTEYLDKLEPKLEQKFQETMDTLSCSQVSAAGLLEKKSKRDDNKEKEELTVAAMPDEGGDLPREVYSQSFFDDTVAGKPKTDFPKKFVQKRGGGGGARRKNMLSSKVPSAPLVQLSQTRALKLKKIADLQFESAVDKVLKQNKEKKQPKREKEVVIDRTVSHAGAVGSIKERLATLQKARTDGTWVECCKEACKKWRFLPNVKDPASLPSYWTCSDNPNPELNDCSHTQEIVEQQDLQLFVETKFTVGSLVWAKLDGFSYWPALIDDDPDTEVYFWTDGDSSVPSWYHVVFFDRLDKQVARAWVRSSCLLRFTDEEESKKAVRCNVSQTMSASTKLRLEEAVRVAETASKTDLAKRRETYCFLTRFKGKWGLPWDLDFSGVGDSVEESSESVDNK